VLRAGIALAVGSHGVSASGVTLEVLHDGRGLVEFTTSCGPPPDPFCYTLSSEILSDGSAHFQATTSLGFATQDSTIGPGGLSGSGSTGWSSYAGPNSELTTYDGASSFPVYFRLSETSEWRLSAELEHGYVALCREPCTDLADHLLLPTHAYPGQGAISVDQTFLLDPGDYRLGLFVASSPGYSGSWSLSFLPVPEPGTAAMLGLGLAILAARRQKAW
jgi:hypothetical protein